MAQRSSLSELLPNGMSLCGVTLQSQRIFCGWFVPPSSMSTPELTLCFCFLSL